MKVTPVFLRMKKNKTGAGRFLPYRPAPVLYKYVLFIDYVDSDEPNSNSLDNSELLRHPFMKMAA